MKRSLLAVSVIILGSFTRRAPAASHRYKSPDSDITRVQLGGVWKEARVRASTAPSCAPTA
jgi:hypothetical protein